MRLHTDSKSATTCVPNTFIDNYMADANGEFVKIYLYLLRCMSYGNDCTISDMADKFEHTEKDIFRALKYWEKLRILRLEYDELGNLSGICLSDSDKSQDAASPQKDSYRIAYQETPGEPEVRQEYSKEELEQFQRSEDVRDLMFIAEKYLGRTLSPSDINAILYWHDSLHFSIPLIEYLIEYCIDKGHRTIRYMDKVALAWAELGYTTAEQAKKASGIHSKNVHTVMKAFGISGRNLVEFELEFIDKWTTQYGFSEDIIAEACKRTMQAIHQPSFEYADSILGSWKKNNVSQMADIALLDRDYQKTRSAAAKTGGSRCSLKTPAAKNRFTNYSQRSYDYAELEKQLLNRSMK